MFTTLRNTVLLLFIFGFVQNRVLGLRGEFPTCRSRDTCIRLTNCVPYMNLIKSLKKPLSRAAVLFLRKQECGFDGLYPMVCCFPSTTRRVQGNRVNYLEEKGFSTKSPTYYVPSMQDIHNNPEADLTETYQPPKKPDFTPSDLSDYRSFKIQDAKILDVPIPVSILSDREPSIETTLKTTTERLKTTTRLFRRKINNDAYTNKATARPKSNHQSEGTRNQKAEEMRRKMEAINNAFMYSTMDYFFVRRMDNDKNRIPES